MEIVVARFILKSMRLVEKVFDSDATIGFVGDVHVGSPQCNTELVLEALDELWGCGAFVVGMGDYIENATKHSVSDVYGQVLPPQEQLNKVRRLFQRFADAGRLIGLLRGNHEIRTYRSTGFSPTRVLCDSLGVSYLGDAQFLKVRAGGNNYHVYVTHGFSGARTRGGKINALIRLTRCAVADLYVMGHVHDLEHVVRPTLRVDNRNKVVVRRDAHFVLSGHFLDYVGSYAQRKAYGLGKTGFVKAFFSGGERDISVEKVEVK